MVNFEAKTHTFLTLFPSLRASILAYCTGTGAVFFESTPSVQKIPDWAKGTAYRRHADVILSPNAEMSVRLIALFAARVFGESRLHTFLLYEWCGTAIASFVSGSWCPTGGQGACETAREGFKRHGDIHCSPSVWRGSCCLGTLSSSQEHFERQVNFWTTEFNSV